MVEDSRRDTVNTELGVVDAPDAKVYFGNRPNQ
jgi:hypothetical protein